MTNEGITISLSQFNHMCEELEELRAYKNQQQGKTDILDKIKAEIEQLRLHKAEFLTSDNKVCIDSQEVLNIIDKYRG